MRDKLRGFLLASFLWGVFYDHPPMIVAAIFLAAGLLGEEEIRCKSNRA